MPYGISDYYLDENKVAEKEQDENHRKVNQGSQIEKITKFHDESKKRQSPYFIRVHGTFIVFELSKMG